jgi:hypothetical protein
LNSHVIAVIVGSAISLIAVYFAEYLRSKRNKKEKKIEVLQNIKSLSRHIYRYAILEAQADVFSNYYKASYELTKDTYHRDEGNRKLRQYEEFKLKYLSLEIEWDKVIVSYSALIGNDSIFKKLTRRFEDYDAPRAKEFTNVNNIDELDEERDKEDERLTREIDATLRIYMEELVEHVENAIEKR